MQKEHQLLLEQYSGPKVFNILYFEYANSVEYIIEAIKNCKLQQLGYYNFSVPIITFLLKDFKNRIKPYPKASINLNDSDFLLQEIDEFILDYIRKTIIITLEFHRQNFPLSGYDGMKYIAVALDTIIDGLLRVNNGEFKYGI